VTTPLALLVASVVLSWVMVLTAGVLIPKGWTLPGLRLMFSNRDHMPEPTPLAARARRASENMLENMVLFVPLLLVAVIARGDPKLVQAGAWTFLVARLAYFPVYLAGILYLRTAAWFVGVVGMALLIASVLQ
jgi:uncharacterized MAPEG superfamily protein